MAIEDFSDLKTQVALFLNRTDLTAQIPVFVQMAESRIYYGSNEPPFVSEPIRLQNMEVSSYATFAAQRVELPDNFLERRRIYIVDGDAKRELDYLPPAQFWKTRAASDTGAPICFTIEGSEIVLGPSPDSSYTGYMLFYEKYDALSADSDTNWLLTNNPGVYLDGALMEAWAYLMDATQQENAHKRFVGRINALNNADKLARHSGTPWVGRSDSGNP